jgi:hypothetical protein
MELDLVGIYFAPERWFWKSDHFSETMDFMNVGVSPETCFVWASAITINLRFYHAFNGYPPTTIPHDCPRLPAFIGT